MDIIKKIAITASMMLFALAQVFSFYVILRSRQEKLLLLREKEEETLERYMWTLERTLQKITYNGVFPESVMIYFFREVMPENTALYKDSRELCNKSPYDFDMGAAEGDENIIYSRQEKLNGKNLLVLHETFRVGKQPYTACYIVDDTFIYKSSRNLLIRELLVSFIMSAAAAVLLVVLIRRITRPLQAANEAQLLLIGSMSHELKSPLTAIRGYSETLLDVRLSEAQMRKSLEYIHSESWRLSRLSEKMMELTKLYEPDCRIVMKPVSMEKLFDAAQESVQIGLEEKGLALVREEGYAGRFKKLDWDLMVSFLINLLNNSIMASEPGGRIFLGAGEKAVWVRDEGRGIPPGELDKICRAFYRVDKSRSRKSGNMGLGLALCEQIATAHGGKLKIESEEGKGTKISLTGIGDVKE